MALKITKDNLARFRQNIHRLTAYSVLIGVPDKTAGRADGSPISNAEIGYLNETGSPSQNIPARPHLVPGVQSILDRATARLKTGAKAALAGDKDAADKAMTAVGLMGQNAVRAKIIDVLEPPLAASTLYKRKHRKKAPREGETPLLDTGGYRNSIVYVVRRRSAGELRKNSDKDK